MKRELYFIRWGNLNPTKHKEARKVDENTWYHVAPCYKGIYAFPNGYVDRFLIGGSYGSHHTVLIKDKNNNPITAKEFYEDHYWEKIKPEYLRLLKKLKVKVKDLKEWVVGDNMYMAYNTKPKKFDYKGLIWHHLERHVSKKDIIDSRHGWIKTTFNVYKDALRKSDTYERFSSFMRLKEKEGERHGNPHTYPNYGDREMYEVFIEKVK